MMKATARSRMLIARGRGLGVAALTRHSALLVAGETALGSLLPCPQVKGACAGRLIVDRPEDDGPQDAVRRDAE